MTSLLRCFERLGVVDVDGLLEGLVDIGDEVLGVLDSDRESDERRGDTEGETGLLGDSSVGHLVRDLSEGLDSTEGLSKDEQLGRLKEEVGLVSSALDGERDHASERNSDGLVPSDLLELSPHLRGERRLGLGVRSVRGKTRVGDRLDERVGREERGDAEGRETVGERSEVESLDSSEGQVGVERRGDRTRGVLEEPEALERLLSSLSNDERSHDDIRVTVDVLGDGVEDNVGSLSDGVGEEGREEGVVDEHQRLGRVRGGNSDKCGNRDDSKGRVGRRLDPDELQNMIRDNVSSCLRQVNGRERLTLVFSRMAS